jgi:hypothetical protein
VERNGKTQLHPHMGMECFFDEQPEADPLWEQTLTELRDANLCSAAKLQALLALPADTLPSSTKRSWPLEFIAQSAARPEDHFSAFVRKLYHLKLSGEPGGLGRRRLISVLRMSGSFQHQSVSGRRQVDSLAERLGATSRLRTVSRQQSNRESIYCFDARCRVAYGETSRHHPSAMSG